MSRLGGIYARTYDLICGKHPQVRPWHFQWLAVKDLYADLERILPQVSGKVLDVGCGEKPYGVWLQRAEKHFGIDVHEGARVDAVIQPGMPWPLENASFDAVLCTQVLQYVDDLEETLNEINRVLSPNGLLIVTVPFMYNEHCLPDDRWRLSVHGARALFKAGYEIIELKAEGGAGSTIGILWLNWIETAMNLYKPTRMAKGALLPVWIPFCAFVNGLGCVMDKFDSTQAFYSNVFLVARKRCN